MMLCGCDPRRGVICSWHCQWQGCTKGRHTPECIRGERINEQRDEAKVSDR